MGRKPLFNALHAVINRILALEAALAPTCRDLRTFFGMVEVEPDTLHQLIGSLEESGFLTLPEIARGFRIALVKQERPARGNVKGPARYEVARTGPGPRFAQDSQTNRSPPQGSGIFFAQNLIPDDAGVQVGGMLLSASKSPKSSSESPAARALNRPKAFPSSGTMCR